MSSKQDSPSSASSSSSAQRQETKTKKRKKPDSEAEQQEEEHKEKGEEPTHKKEEEDESEEEEEEDTAPQNKKKKVLKSSALSKKKLEKFRKTKERKGIVYLSRIPPFMKPEKLRHLLSHYGTVERIYLTPEDPRKRNHRKKRGGNKKQNWTDGWVEFADKKVAKQVALSLNNTPIGGNKRNFYYYDLWNLKYLPNFKWNHLTEKLAYQRSVREKKRLAEITQVKRENNEYMLKVEQAHVQREIEKRKQKKQKKEEGEEEVSEEEEGEDRKKLEQFKKKFRQRTFQKDSELASSGSTSSNIAEDVLAKLFGN
ncbi:Activator of basal transcription 1 [Balamuthia mandrillaris]